MLHHPITNFEIQNEPKFNGVYSRNNLSRISIEYKQYKQVKIMKIYCNVCNKYRKSKNTKI